MAAFFAESIQGVGGSVQFPKGFVKSAFERTRELGGVCISDEVQTGFGRTGEHYWGFEGHGVLPDIVTMAKGEHDRLFSILNLIFASSVIMIMPYFY